MADNKIIDETTAEGRIHEPVCIDAKRVYDSCGDKDCLSDMPVFFTAEDQALIDQAVSVRLRESEAVDVLIDTEPVPFHRGFYAVDIAYFFTVTLDVYSSPKSAPASVTGVCIWEKKVILYGSEGNVKVFSSDMAFKDYDDQNAPSSSMPIAQVQVAQPIALAASLCPKQPIQRLPRQLPETVVGRLGADVTDEGINTVQCTLGVFSIVQLMRSVQMLIPSFDYCVPGKSCSYRDDSPCDMFSRLEFPTEEFFPPDVGEADNACGCGSEGFSAE